MSYVALYESAPDFLEKVPEHIDAHRARWQQFQDAGTLLMIGPFLPPSLGAMAVFTTREAAQEFVRGDPFVLHGVVSRWEIREWDEAIGSQS